MNTPDLDIVRLVYASRMTRACSPQELVNIMESSRKNNYEAGLTGALCYSGRGFLQCLEGSRQYVNEVYRRIVNDPRNEDVTLIDYAVVEERIFGRWSMAYIRSDAIDKMILVKHGLTASFDPFALTPDQALGFLYDTAKERAAFLASQVA